ncbi:hypothetical protein [Consotaella aegiceratis]|uniref:hypothetical protein n=1 Tax=Consotaella aegiceratis TaxID=3097961 RepID=UPI002F411BF7
MTATPRLTAQKIAAYCRQRAAPVLTPEETEAIRAYLADLLAVRAFPPYRGRWIDVVPIAETTGIAPASLLAARNHLQPVFDALCRALAAPEQKAEPVQKPRPATRRKPGRKPRPIVQYPDPIQPASEDPEDFAAALRLQIERHGETAHYLHRAIADTGIAFEPQTISNWCKGASAPRTVKSLEVLKQIEERYRLPDGYFGAKLPRRNHAVRGHMLADIPASERRRLAWHLPDDFSRRSAAEQIEILTWVRTVVISGSTEYRRFQAAAMKQRYAIRFRNFDGTRRRWNLKPTSLSNGVVDAPARLQREMDDLLRFKTATLTTFGFHRNGVWNPETAAQKIEHFGLMFGALAASRDGEIAGFGVDLASLSFGIFVFPAVWDWYLQWREQRRGFYTQWEVDMLSIVLGLVRENTGWLRQTPRLAEHLTPIPGLVSKIDIAEAQSDWNAACDAMHRHGRSRIKEIERVARVHRDPFEPILPILEAKSPVGEYRKITEEILRLMPDERRYPRAAAEAVRSFLMLRLGLHLGLRQKNLRELLVCPLGRLPTGERRLEELRRGELRWNSREAGWEVLIPSVAFKNANSSFFGSKPFRLILPDLGSLYDMISTYIVRHRHRLVGPAKDPGTFFVKTVKMRSANAAYDQNTFYEAWRLTIQRYGIYNPYTGNGVIKGLLPHGPHNVRDVLATHILKQTGSYEQASYAIQDTPEMVAQHYGRFLPQDKAEIAAQILNRVWEAA